MPTVLIKENNLRGQNRSKLESGFMGYKWLFVFDRASNECYQILDIFLPLINRATDYIHALTLLPPYIAYDDIKKQFINQMETLGLPQEQYGYQKEEYTKKPSLIVKELVNSGEEHHFDFVVFFNNQDKFKMERQCSDNISLITNICANVCFVNGSYISMKNYEKNNETNPFIISTFEPPKNLDAMLS
jgi:hypothetical protein